MSDFVKDSENKMELKKDTREKISDLHNRWLALQAWSNDQTTFLVTLIANWQVFRQYMITILDFISAKEKEVQKLDIPANLADYEDSKEQIAQLEVSDNLRQNASRSNI